MSLPPQLSVPLELPAVAAPMFIVSDPALVVAQCKAGVIGSFPSLNARPLAQLREWLAQIEEELAAHNAANPERPAAPFAANLIVHRSNDRLEADLATIVEFEVPIVITSLGARPEVNDAVHAYGGIVLHDIIHNAFAHKAIDKGADGLIAVSAGAGGHAGMQSPFALVREIREWFDGPLLLSGAIAHGASILAAQAVGADLAYVGSAFLATREARAMPEYKQMLVDSGAMDIVYSNLFTGIHGNYLRGSIEAAGLDPDALAGGTPQTMDFASFAEAQGVKAWKDIWGAGQGIGAIKEIASVADVVGRMKAEYDTAVAELLPRVPAQVSAR